MRLQPSFVFCGSASEPILSVADGHGVVIWLFNVLFYFCCMTLMQADHHGVDDLLERSKMTC